MPRSRGSDTDAPTTVERGPGEARRLAEALADPLRADVFDALAVLLPNATASQLGDLLGHPTAEIVGALSVLEACNVVEPLAGAAGPGDSPPYRVTEDGLISDEEWEEFPPALRRRLLARQLDQMHERIRQAVGRGGFDPPDVHVRWLPTDLDGLGYQDVVRLLVETLNRARDIQVAAVQRRASGAADDEAIRSSMMLIHFLEPEPGARPEAADESMRDRMEALSATIADQLPRESPDWERIAESATTLAALARRRSTASIVR